MFALASLLLAASAAVFPLGTPFAQGTDPAVTFIGNQPVIVWRLGDAVRSVAWNGAPVPREGISTIATGVASAPAVAASGGEALAVWIESPHGYGYVFASRIACDGQPIGQPFSVGSGPGPATSVTVFGGASSWLVVWGDSLNTVSSAVVGRNGRVLTLPRTVAKTGAPLTTVAGASSGPEFLVTWGTANPLEGVFAARISSSGQLIASPLRLGDGVAPAAEWNGHEYLVVWEDAGIRGVRLTAELAPAGAPLRMTTLFDSNPHVAWDGSGYVLGFTRYDQFHHATFFVVRAIRLTADGLPAESLGDQNEAVGAGIFALAALNGRALLLHDPTPLTVSEAILGPPRKLARRRL